MLCAHHIGSNASPDATVHTWWSFYVVPYLHRQVFARFCGGFSVESAQFLRNTFVAAENRRDTVARLLDIPSKHGLNISRYKF